MTRVLGRIFVFAMMVGVMTPLIAQQEKTEPATVAGNWKLVVESPHGAVTLALELKVDATGKVTGTMAGEQMGTMTVAGTFAQGRLVFSVANGPDELSFAGKLKDADTLIGMLTGHGDMAATASRVKKE